jgi:hypothetical protein
MNSFPLKSLSLTLNANFCVGSKVPYPLLEIIYLVFALVKSMHVSLRLKMRMILEVLGHKKAALVSAAAITH